MNDTLTFANPLFLVLLAGLIPLVLLRLRSQRFRDLAIAALLAPRLRDRLLVGRRPAAHWARFSLQLISLALLVVAIAGPRYGHTEEETIAEGRNVLIAIDTSRSMLAPDLKPDRLTRAKLAAHDLIRSLPGDRFGLIAFAGTSFLQAPLTIDHEAVIESISQLDTEIIPRGGTHLGRALELARETFTKAESENNALILFSDGEDLESKDLPAAADNTADAPSMTVIAVGTGTAAGAIIPDTDAPEPGKFIRDSAGEIVRSRLDATNLQALADSTGGIYLHLNSTAAMQQVVAGALDRLDKSTMEGRTIYKLTERFQWALFPAILLALVSLLPLPTHASLRISDQSRTPIKAQDKAPATAIGREAVRNQPERRGGTSQSVRASSEQDNPPDSHEPPRTPNIQRVPIAPVILLALFLITPASANPHEAWQKYDSGDYEAASATYDESLARKSLHSKERLHYGSASAAYRMGDFEKAIQSYGDALLSDKPAMQERAHYSLGNALYREGEARLQGEKADPEQALVQWRNALDHYSAALALNRGNENAQFNHGLVAQRIKELEQQQQQQQQQQQDQNDQQKQDEEQKQDQDKKDQQGDKEGDQEKQDKEEKKDQEGKDGDQENEQDEGDKNQDQNDKNQEKPEEEPMEEPETPEGQLQAEENPEQSQQPKPAPEQEQPHPETGFTRSQARQILRSLADEDLDVRPLVPPSREAVFKNW